MGEKTQKLAVIPDVYEEMLKSSLILRNQIRQKHEKGLGITKEEANFVNDFEKYSQQVFEAIDEQENREIIQETKESIDKKDSQNQ